MELMIASNSEIETSFFCHGGSCKLLSTNMDTEHLTLTSASSHNCLLVVIS